MPEQLVHTGYTPLGEGIQRTELDCHNCNKKFVAELDYCICGNHIIECPHCGHEHCRVIEQGKITAERWSSRHSDIKVSTRSVWKSSVLQAKTSTVSQYLRDKWLNYGQ